MTMGKNNRSENSKNSENKNQSSIKVDISSDPVYGEPQDVFDMVNKYGTYNIQPTSDTHHDYPKIAQGLSETQNDESKKKKFGQK